MGNLSPPPGSPDPPTPPSPPAGPPHTGTARPADTPDPSEATRKQMFEFAGDATKQLITVATGVVAATAIFSKDLDTTTRYMALASWIVLTISVVLGLLALLTMTGNLHLASVNKVAPTLSEEIHFWSRWQVGSFLIGILLVILFGFFAAGAKSPSADKQMTVNCVVPNPPAPVVVQVPTPSSPPTSEGPYEIYFDSDKAFPRLGSETTLAQIQKLLVDRPALGVEVQGHTDNTGTRAHNEALSEQRAAMVTAWLVSRGILASRITSKGYGETRPAAPNNTPEGRALNRRAVVVRLN
jgi:outer membrane protein OmpA-like peptidoglycan-associated protein